MSFFKELRRRNVFRVGAACIVAEIVGQPEFRNIQSDPGWLPFLESIGKLPAQLDEIKFEVSVPQ